MSPEDLAALEDQDEFDAVFLTPASDGVEPSIAFRWVGGPKRYKRFWLRTGYQDWGWVVHASAVLLWAAGSRVELETGVAFDDEPHILHVGSSFATGIMTRQHDGRSLSHHPGRRWVIRTPVESDDADAAEAREER